MPDKRRARLLVGIGAFVGLCAAVAGCQTPGSHSTVKHNTPLAMRPATAGPSQAGSPAAQPVTQVSYAPGVLAPRTELHWSVASAQNLSRLLMAGPTQVGPNGNIELGPYGSVRVAGLTLDQARAAIEKQLAPYIPGPRVSLQRLAGETCVVARWRPAQRHPEDRPIQTTAGTAGPGIVARASWQASASAQAPGRAPGTASAPGLLQVESPGVETVGPPSPLPDQPPGGIAHPPEHTVGHSPHGGAIAPAPAETRLVSLPPYIVGPPDILLIQSTKGVKDVQEVKGPHLVRPDGSVGVGIYGSVQVAGMTLDQAREAVARLIYARLDPDKVKFKDVFENTSVDVLAYNSKVYYVITDGGGYGEQVTAFPITGGETVLDALSKINGLPPVASKKHIWVARRNGADGSNPKTLPVDWVGITQRGAWGTNYQVFPGDRIYVKADRWRTFDARLAKILAPLERLLGVTLLASETVNSIGGRGSGGGGR